MSFQSVLFIFLFTLPIGCSQFQTGRTYLSEMEHDDSSFFNPQEDFPVVAGDNGKFWMDEEERRARTPASEEEILASRFTRSLKNELRSLEAMQSEESLDFYKQYKNQLGSDSQRIYFLNLPPYERKEYLLTKGILAEKKGPSFTATERIFAVRKSDILTGMTKDDVLESMGKPMRVEIAGNPRYENERWLYRMNGASKYIYFESGQVQGWE
jgi:hypothetical protein